MTKLYPISLIFLSLTLFACGTKEKHPQENAYALSHNKVEIPDYATVFPDDKVQKIEIKIDSADWNNIQADLAESFKDMPSGPPFMGKGEHPPFKEGEMPFHPPKPGDGNKAHIQGPPPHGMKMGSDTNPIWVESEVKFNDKTWSHVGIRVKGNSSLLNTFRSRGKKFSFKLDFEQFEDSFPSTKNQRFYGFKQLNLNNNFQDPSFMREKVAADLFRAFGLVAARASFYEVYIDLGTGIPEYFGLYTLLEEMDDSPIKTQLNNKKGNLYKPENQSATFAKDTFVEEDMRKKNNKSVSDYSDVKKLHAVINSSERTTDPIAWKTELEAVFNVDIFLKWLAVNATIQNWDSYGQSAHNYYMYNNPADSLLTWIPWDHNEALQKGKGRGSMDLSLATQGGNWPLIEYIIEQPEYLERYKAYLLQFIEEDFSTEKITEMYTEYGKLLSPFTKKEQNEDSRASENSSFHTAVEALKQHVESRNKDVNAFLYPENNYVSNDE